MSRFGSHGVVKVATGSVITSEKKSFEDSETLIVFPNPASRQIQSTISGRLSIFNLTGKTLLKVNVKVNEKIDLPHGIAPGIYKVRLLSGQGKQYQQTLVVQ